VFRAAPATDDDRARIIRRHCALIREHLPDRAALLQMKKHLAWYSSGRPFGARLRPALFSASGADAVEALFWSAWSAVTA
jgi:tRNA-dihydrouridine synthase